MVHLTCNISHTFFLKHIVLGYNHKNIYVTPLT